MEAVKQSFGCFALSSDGVTYSATCIRRRRLMSDVKVPEVAQPTGMSCVV